MLTSPQSHMKSCSSNREFVTWNPVTGCTKVSQGCKNCYAERIAKRLMELGAEKYSQGFKVRIHENLVDRPHLWRKPKLVFVNSMSDLFHDKVPTIFIQRLFRVMAECQRHTFQVLTKRTARLKEIASLLEWPPNIWMGVSVEDERVISRIDDLLTCPAKNKFLSLEPLIGPLPKLPLLGIDWVIAGKESGPNARPLKLTWIADIREQCKAAGVPFFFKQPGVTSKNISARTLSITIYETFPKSLIEGLQPTLFKP
jgi:protein gp37